MRARLLLFGDRLRASYWFVPSVMLAASAALAVALVALDQRIETEDLRGLWWIFSGGAEGARAVLSAVAGSVIGVAGTTFSITIAVLSLTSSQFGPRLLRGFLRDTANQVVLGTFVATFLYCLLVLRTVRSVEESAFVPHVAVTAGVLFAVASVCVLIYFIHHVSASIQASRVIAGVAGELEAAIDRLFPDEIGREADGEDEENGEEDPEDARVVRAAGRGGYVQAVDGDALLALAEERDCRITLLRAPGQFAMRGGPLASVYPPPADGEADRDVAERVNAAFTRGEQRTGAQDAEYLLTELVEVAVRALSPGINDPFTALMCLDRLGAALCHLAGRAFPRARRFDRGGALRIVARPRTFAGMVETAFREIRHYGGSDPAVAQRLRDVLRELLACARTDEQRAAVRAEAARAGGDPTRRR